MNIHLSKMDTDVFCHLLIERSSTRQDELVALLYPHHIQYGLRLSPEAHFITAFVYKSVSPTRLGTLLKSGLSFLQLHSPGA